MRKEIPQSNWVDLLMRFAKDNEGRVVRLTVETSQEGEKLLGELPLVAFEGDCSGEIVKAVKVVLGAEGEHPDNLFHVIQFPEIVEIEESKDGTVNKLIVRDKQGRVSILEIQ